MRKYDCDNFDDKFKTYMINDTFDFCKSLLLSLSKKYKHDMITQIICSKHSSLIINMRP